MKLCVLFSSQKVMMKKSLLSNIINNKKVLKFISVHAVQVICSSSSCSSNKMILFWLFCLKILPCQATTFCPDHLPILPGNRNRSAILFQIQSIKLYFQEGNKQNKQNSSILFILFEKSAI